jgi:hypothetical protein
MRNLRCFWWPVSLSATLMFAGACNYRATTATGGGGTVDLSRAGAAGHSAAALKDDQAVENTAPTAGQADAGSQRDAGLVLDCVQGGPVSEVHAEFHCGSVTVYTCKDLSNVVLEFDNGQRERFEGLSGHANVFSGTGANANARVTRVWIKAGANQSGEGPGYGHRSDAPDESCAPPAAGSGGAGGTNEPCMIGPDMLCAQQPVAGTGSAAGSGASPD